MARKSNNVAQCGYIRGDFRILPPPAPNEQTAPARHSRDTRATPFGGVGPRTHNFVHVHIIWAKTHHLDFFQQLNAKGTIGPQFVRECAFVVLIGPPSAHYEPETHEGYVGPSLAGGDGLEHGSIEGTSDTQGMMLWQNNKVCTFNDVCMYETFLK